MAPFMFDPRREALRRTLWAKLSIETEPAEDGTPQRAAPCSVCGHLIPRIRLARIVYDYEREPHLCHEGACQVEHMSNRYPRLQEV